MENIVKTLDIKFKLITVISRYYKTKIECLKEIEYTQSVKDISKILEEIYDLKIKAIEHKIPADKHQKDIDVWDQEMQSKTHVYETIIEMLEHQMGKLRQGSMEKQGPEDELTTKKRDNKGV